MAVEVKVSLVFWILVVVVVVDIPVELESINMKKFTAKKNVRD